MLVKLVDPLSVKIVIDLLSQHLQHFIFIFLLLLLFFQILVLLLFSGGALDFGPEVVVGAELALDSG